MRILRAQGHFGILNGKEIAFDRGLDVRYLPNEGGKTTLCDFIRVMLYGLNTAKRDTRQQLSDKTKYHPADGKPMSGLLEVEFQGRRIVISRQTGKGGPMQEFSARYADTGEECRMLTSKNCGERLTGVGEEAFRSSAMLDGLNAAVSAAELSDRILALSTTGDNAMQYAQAVQQLDKWRSQLKGGVHGKLAKNDAELEQVQERLTHLDKLEAEIRELEQQLPAAQQRVQKKEEAYRAIQTKQFVQSAGKRERAQQREQEAKEAAEKLRSRLPDLRKLKTVENALGAYDAAHPNQYGTYEPEGKQRKRKPRLWAMLLAIVCVVAAIGCMELSGGMAGLLAGLAIVLFLLGWRGTKPREKAKQPEEIDETRETLLEAAADLGIAEQNIHEIRAQVAALAQLREQYLEARQHQEQMAEEYLDLLEQEESAGLQQLLDLADGELAAAREAMEELQQEIAVCRGRCAEIGDAAVLRQRQKELREAHEDILWNLDAIALAKKSLVRVNAELTARMSPQINRLAQHYLQILTNNKYTALQLYTNFEAVCRAENSAVELDRLRLSSGTRDQLYLALRLAACTVLLDNGTETVPLILDDPFLTYDEERTACAMQLLRHLSNERQILLLTCHRLG
ncbi:MAG: AAA family ATPase [Eubacteriales bacterium]|nr:AAA family ATPase [Eubacteriales bacterium]